MVLDVDTIEAPARIAQPPAVERRGALPIAVWVRQESPGARADDRMERVNGPSRPAGQGRSRTRERRLERGRGAV